MATRTPTPQEINQQRIAEQRRKNQEFERLRSISSARTVRRPIPQNVRRDIERIYRNTNKEELKTLAPNREDSDKFAAFLRQPNTGLTRLAADLGCAENTNVIVASADCIKYSMPGAGSSYSFRVNDYRIWRLADLTFTDNSFQATGALLHGILVGIGNVPLEKVNLQSNGVKFLVDFQTAADFEKAQKIARQVVDGIDKDGFFYRRGLKAIENMTYVLRSIAYDGEFYRAVSGITYNELDFDKRKDIIVAFRIVRRDADGSVTILWKELAKKDAPKIRRKIEDINKPVKENNFTAKSINK